MSLFLFMMNHTGLNAFHMSTMRKCKASESDESQRELLNIVTVHRLNMYILKSCLLLVKRCALSSGLLAVTDWVKNKTVQENRG